MGSFFVYPTEAQQSFDSFVFLAGRAEQDWQRIARHSDRLRFRAGELLVREGERDRAVYIVLRGRLEALLDPPVPIDEGSVFGELSFLDGLPRSSTVRAVADGEALRLSYDEFETLAARHPELGRAIALDLGRIVAARLRRIGAQ
jgi:CRP/FNR family transcriptional regulator, cyclic AMP receptor protein